MRTDFRLDQTVQFLNSKGIKMSSGNQWLEGCFNWYISSNPQATMSSIQTFVYEQWLLADLRDVSEQCITENMLNNSKSSLNGSYALQVDSFLDVGNSCYSQLQKIKNTVSSNAEIGETKPQTWEPKSSRMLKLTCTDGVKTIYGMEYKPLPVLREPFIPGLKVLITGPIECRRGVLLLEPRNIQVLGGETDSLLISNAVENVLARILNVEENPNPYQNIAVPVSNENSAGSSDHENLTCGPQGSEVDTSMEVVNTGFTDSDDDLMLCDQVEQIETYYSQTAISTSDVTTASVSNTVNIDNRETSIPSSKKPLVGVACQIVAPTNQLSVRGTDFKRTTAKSVSEISVADSGNTVSNPVNERINSIKSNCENNNTNIASKRYELSSHNKYNGDSVTNSPEHNNWSNNVSSNVLNSSSSYIISKGNNLNSHNQYSNDNVTNSASDKWSNSDVSNRVNNSNSYVTNKKNEPSFYNKCTNINSDSVIEEMSGILNNSDMSASISNERITKDSGICMSDSSSTTSYLSIASNKICQNPRIVCVQGSVQKLTSNPKIQNNLWTLSGVINDGLKNIEVTFSNTFLERSFGKTASQMVADKSAIHNDPLLKERTVNMLKEGKKKISTMKGRIKLEYISQDQIPRVLDVSS